MKLTHRHIQQELGGQAFQRGIAYYNAGKVLEFEATETPSGYRVTGSTSGSRDEVYAQDIKLAARGEGVALEGVCSCPVMLDCKHVAAVLCAWSAQLHGARKPADSPTAVLNWLGDLARLATAEAYVPEPGDEYIVYLLDAVAANRGADAREVVRVEPRVVKLRADGRKISRGRAIDLDTSSFNHANAARVTQSVDRDIATLLSGLRMYSGWYSLRGSAAYHAMQRMLDTARVHWALPTNPPLTRGPARRLRLEWQSRSATLLGLDAEVDGGGYVLPSEPPLYVDPAQSLVGELDAGGLNGEQLSMLAAAPALPVSQAMKVSSALVSQFRQLPLPPPAAIDVRENKGAVPVPVARICGDVALGGARAYLMLDMRYGDDLLPADARTSLSTRQTASGFLTVERDRAVEAAAHARLLALGFERASASPDRARVDGTGYVAAGDTELEHVSRWAALLRERDALTQEGWHIDVAPDFPLSFETADWFADVDENSGIDWFGVSFHFKIGEERVPLLDALEPVLGMNWAALPEIVVVRIGAQRYVEIPSARLRPLLDLLAEIFNRTPRGSTPRLSRFDAPLLEELATLGLAIHGDQQWRALAERLRDFEGLAPVAPDPGLVAELRPYQLKGLAWLQFLREYGFNGILADDMGLGKTLQTLAHLLAEKRAGRLTAPALVVAPTSLMGNWRRETLRFAPDLSVVVLHGPERHSRFDAASRADIVLTTYALLPRDEERLSRLEFHSVILDEAQNVKNPRAKAAFVVRMLHTRHRLCLTGTPLENHLGELWALFDFLMPGFLGDADSFRRLYRTPIETHRDLAKQASLARRIAPFMLRRTKQAVAADLPPKTEIVQRIEFDTAQADRYESVRLTVERRVRDAIEQQGFARSQITILDALLKLRQVCCDPRLLKTEDTLSTPSAKLDRLLELLEELRDEGRRVLVFSQFTSMLELIAQALTERGIGYTKLTGKTKRRDEAIDAFRLGEVDVFLISLKAGGVGLNLPEADTVIHYDPWWNPAAEAQATDRAHRIGQTQPVFVYKLIIDGSVEEKMLELQARKRALAQGVYADPGADDGPLLDGTTLASLFEPLVQE